MGQARIFGQTAAAGNSSINIASGPALPSEVVGGQLFILTDKTVSAYYISTNDPDYPMPGEVWVQVGRTDELWHLREKTPRIALGIVFAWYCSIAGMESLDAYLGVSGEWVQVASKLPAVGIALQDCTWKEIDLISRSGKASEYFNIGDRKTKTVNGVTYSDEIIGFAHDDLADGSGKAGITFGMVSCMSATQKMNTTSTNAGGWGASALREVLRTTIFNQHTEDHRAVIKTVLKKTSAGSQSSTINTTEDTLFLPSEIEVFGSNTYAFTGEGTQYARFVDTASRKKSNSSWWERSPRKDNNTYFCYVSSAGAAGVNTASGSSGVAFCYCI